MIREMTLNDLDVIDKIEKTIFSCAWSKADYGYELTSNPYARYFVLEEKSTIVGYVGCWITFEKAQITTIGVDKDYQSKGYGKLLLDKVTEVANEEKCENISLEVRVSNSIAISMYENNGFINVNTRKSYYSDNYEDAYLMIKPLGGAYE